MEDEWEKVVPPPEPVSTDAEMLLLPRMGDGETPLILVDDGDGWNVVDAPCAPPSRAHISAAAAAARPPALPHATR